MIKVLIVSPYFYPYLGVGAARMSSLASYLRIKEDLDVSILRYSNSVYADDISLERYINLYNEYYVTECKNFLSNIHSYKKALNKLLKNFSFDVILISVGPFYTLPLVRYIKRISDSATILDFRDFWAHEPTVEKTNDIKVRFQNFVKDRFFERPAIKYTNALVSCDQEGLDLLERVYGISDKRIDKVIFNGYDGALLKQIDVEKRMCIMNNQVNLMIFGKFSDYLTLDYLENFAKGLMEYQKDSKIKLKVKHVGKNENKLLNILSRYDIEYECTGFIDYIDGIELIIREGDIALVSCDLIGVGFGTKVFDYIYCDKPIIFMGDKRTILYSFISSFENGFACETSNDICEAICSIVDNGLFTLDSKVDVESYSREVQNEKFANLIRKLAHNKEIID